MCEIEVGNFIATPKGDGTWLYKSKDSNIPTKKAEAKYKEKPQYALIEEYEGVAKTKFRTRLNETVKEVVKFIKNL